MKIWSTSVALPHGDTVHIPTAFNAKSAVIFVFADADASDTHQVVDDIAASAPLAHIVGCSTAGTIRGDDVVDRSISIVAVLLSAARIVSASAPLNNGRSTFEAAQDVGRQLACDDLKAAFIVADGLHANGSELVHGLLSTIGSECVIGGALAGDGNRWSATWTLHNGAIESNHVVAVGFCGDSLIAGQGMGLGWDAFGPPRRITKSKGREVFMLDGRPALDLYEEYLGDLASKLPGIGLRFPLGIRSAVDGEDELLVRTMVDIDESHRSVIMAGEMPEGWTAQLMHGNPDRLIGGAVEAARRASAGHARDTGLLALAFSCIGRRGVLRDRVVEEIESAKFALPADTQLAGFYSYGEIGHDQHRTPGFQNQAISILLLGEI